MPDTNPAQQTDSTAPSKVPLGNGAASDTLVRALTEFARTGLVDAATEEILKQLLAWVVEIVPGCHACVTLSASGRRPAQAVTSGPFAPRRGKRRPDAFALRHRGRRVGALELYRQSAGPLAEPAAAAVQALSDVAAAYLVNAQRRAELERVSALSQQAALHDALTGLPNRALISQLLEHAAGRRQRSGATSAVLFVDLDRFKDVNDSYGHRAGDQLLVTIAHRLRQTLRPGDTLARLAGDEFLVLCEELATEDEAEVIASRIRDAVAQPCVLGDQWTVVTASIGVAFVRPGCDSVDDLLEEADHAMYRDKRARADSSGVDHPWPAPRRPSPTALAAELREARRRGEIEIVYAPIVDASDGRLATVEASLQWRHPVRGEIPAAVLLSLAEASGESIGMGRWTLERVWSDRHHWHNGDRDISVLMRLPAEWLLAPGLTETLASVLADVPRHTVRAALAISADALQREQDRMLATMGQLAQLGARLIVDDLSTQPPDLCRLAEVGIDGVRLDRALTGRPAEDPRRRAAVQSLIRQAHEAEATVIAQDVRTALTQRVLTALGTDRLQGPYIGGRWPPRRSRGTRRPRRASTGGSRRIPQPSRTSRGESRRDRPRPSRQRRTVGADEDGISGSIRSRSRTLARRSRREICICEHPRRSAISDCLRSCSMRRVSACRSTKGNCPMATRSARATSTRPSPSSSRPIESAIVWGPSASVSEVGASSEIE